MRRLPWSRPAVILCALALGPLGCPDSDEVDTTGQTSANSTGATAGTGSTTDPSTSTTTDDTTSTTDPSTSSSSSSGDPATGTSSTTDPTTGVDPDDPYHACSPNGASCDEDDFCLLVDPFQLPGTCAPPCNNNNNDCPESVDGDGNPVCNLDQDNRGGGDHCVLGCSFDSANCPEGMECVMASFGASVCIWPQS